MCNGFIVLQRQIKNWQWWHNSTARALWVYILIEANWADGYNRDGTLIPRGSFARSLRNIADETGVSINTVRHWLKEFEKANQITVSTTHGYTIINVINYGKYQDRNCITDTPTDTPTDTVTDTPTDTDITRKQENKNNNKDIYRSSEEVKEVIDWLNHRAGTRYKYSKSACSHINARLKEGFTVQDCKDVIDKKCTEWMGTEMEKYIRPETLFGSKFENYLNARITNKRKELAF